MSKDARQNLFKKAISSTDGREKRENVSFRIRRERKETRLNHKRSIKDPNESQSKIDPRILDDFITQSALLKSEDKFIRFRAVQTIRQKLSIQTNPPINEAIKSGIIPQIINFLTFADDPELQLECAWSLTNIASGNSYQTSILIQNGAIPNLISLLSSPKHQVREQGIWALGNIAGDNIFCRNIVLSAGLLPQLLIQYTDPSLPMSLVKNATWTLSNLCRGKPPPDISVILPAIPLLALLLKINDSDLLSDSCWALSYISDGDKNCIQLVMDTGITPRLIELTGHNHYQVQIPAIRCLGNFISGTNEQTDAVLNCGVLKSFIKLLDDKKPTILSEVCWTISNIAAGTEEQLQMLISSGAIPHILRLMEKSTFDVRKETAYTIFNLTSNNNQKIVEYLVGLGVIPILIQLLSLTDIELKDVTLSAIEHILRIGSFIQMNLQLTDNPYSNIIIMSGGGDILVHLQEHLDRGIQDKADHILKNYFHTEEVDEVGNNDGSGQAFTGFN